MGRIDGKNRWRDVLFPLERMGREPSEKFEKRRFLARLIPYIAEAGAIVMALVIPGVRLNFHTYFVFGR